MLFRSIADLQHALTWKAKISRVQQLPKDTLIGYGGTYSTKEVATVATIPVGYADGYNRLLSNYGYVLCKGQKLPVIGRVCMDQFMVDASNLPEVHVGDEVILIGQDQDASITVEEMAEMLNTINHEIVCRIALRVPKIFI